MIMLAANFKPLLSNKHKIADIFQELIFYKEMLYSLQMSYRIYQDEGTLTSLRLVQKLHDQTLLMAQHKKAQQVVVRSDIDFEQALQYVLS
jgi:hypothetical protein